MAVVGEAEAALTFEDVRAKRLLDEMTDGQADVPMTDLSASAELLVGGRPLPRPSRCKHQTLIMEMGGANLVEDADGSPVWEVLFGALCAICGTPFDFDAESARLPFSVDHGLVVVGRPAPPA